MRLLRALTGASTCVLLTACGGGDGAGVTPPASVTPVVTSVAVTPTVATIIVGGTQQLTAAAKNANGNTITGRTFTWSSAASYIATVSQTGAVTGTGVGDATITATEQASGQSATGQVTVNAPPRPLGSLLTFGEDSVLQYGSWLYVSSLGVVDTSAAGKDYRIGVVRKANVPFVAPILRSSFPQLTAIAECPNGETYVTAFAIPSITGVTLWRIDLQTAFVTNLGELDIRPFAVSSILCDASNSILIAGNFADLLGHLYRDSGALINSIGERYLGLAQSPAGIVHATINSFATPQQGQLLVTINTSSGTVTPAGVGQQRHLPGVREMAFRGSRLLGISGRSLVEINTTTGVVTSIRTVKIP